MEKGRNIMVIGASAGGLEALDQLIGQFPTDIPAAILIIQHMSPENTGVALLHRLGKYKAFECALAAKRGEGCTRTNLHWPF
jgi:two-component system, chemotaxis family, protein-glutamate methylesterase/glutaminase